MSILHPQHIEQYNTLNERELDGMHIMGNQRRFLNRFRRALSKKSSLSTDVACYVLDVDKEGPIESGHETERWQMQDFQIFITAPKHTEAKKKPKQYRAA